MSKKKLNFLITGLILCVLPAFSIKERGDKEPETKVVLETSLGKIKLKLYNETPKHRDNFIKLVKDHFYDGVLFHRVIQSFMIQSGDPDSKNAKQGAMLGNGEFGSTLPAEFDPKLFHKMGALAAARQGDDVNPKKESSGCQFYIVQGRPFTDSLLNLQEQRINNYSKQMICNNLLGMPENAKDKERVLAFQQTRQMDSLLAVIAKYQPAVEAEFAKTTPYKFSDEQRKAYTTLGGAPHLDGSYTVYGEVLEGMDIVDKIAAVQVDGNARPVEDVRIIKAYIVKK